MILFWIWICFLFFFDILEIKLAGNYTNNPPQWITDLMESELLIECFKFSKYAQSVNEFYKNKINIIPKWSDFVTNAHANKKEFITNQPVEIESVATKCTNMFSVFRNCKKDVDKKQKSLNPKIYFSNERTFLGWFQAAVFIGGAGLTIHSSNIHDPAGFTLLAVALLVLVWAIILYYRRNYKLIHGQMNGLHDLYGPAILVSVIILVFSYSIITGNDTV
eukprot:10668_1